MPQGPAKFQLTFIKPYFIEQPCQKELKVLKEH
jgi:hypothetical protein